MFANGIERRCRLLMWMLGISGLALVLWMTLPAQAQDKAAPPDRGGAVDEDGDDDDLPPPPPEARRGRPGRERDDCGDDPWEGWRGRKKDLDGHRCGGGGKRNDADEMPPLPPEIEKRIMEILREEFPDFHDRVEKMRKCNPNTCNCLLRRLAPLMREYDELSQHDPESAKTIIEEFRVEQQLRDLGQAYQEAKKADKKKEMADLEAEIAKLAGTQFDLQSKRRVARLNQFERRLREQHDRLALERKEHKEMVEKKADVIAKRVEQIKKGERRGMRDGRRGEGFGERPGRDHAGDKDRAREHRRDGRDMDGPPRHGDGPPPDADGRPGPDDDDRPSPDGDAPPRHPADDVDADD